MDSKSTAHQVASFLLETEAVKLRPEQPFKWSSGWNSPIYCDNRVTLSFPHIRSYIKEQLAALVKQRFPEAEAIAGVATAGIAQGALVAEQLEMPFLYVRPEPKKHGMGNQIEGRLLKGQKVVLVEDLISTGGSSLKAAAAVQEAGAEVIGMVAIFTYGFALADENFKTAGIPLHCLSNYKALLEAAAEQGYIQESATQALSQWRQSPETWAV
ncbi:orotate phosphoribosyltransferase [Pontibacter ummariensis]|uniref:Orotate phosphoribosyltransferase n=1 Tax=Pontibacter ummariensis TaxID=1610492 RepID=A0A239C6M3_9BACT|nr:orotate phosphoribosyltransferase [Pontibacter ummariensis]PRY15439.1 orotate phosphoribosyltransferase [Pontibacter ummariensis]SNS15318.1 orotate phosphoribosyltransferase [Pontibacter ummariensis]